MAQDDRLDKFLEDHIPVSKPRIQSLAKYHYPKQQDSPWCNEFAAMGAEALTSSGREEVYLVYANEHVVVYDLIDTWDFRFNIVFRNYRYPMLNALRTNKSKIWEEVKEFQFFEAWSTKYYEFLEVPLSTYKLVRNL